jgi:hypothetical protein
MQQPSDLIRLARLTVIGARSFDFAGQSVQAAESGRERKMQQPSDLIRLVRLTVIGARSLDFAGSPVQAAESGRLREKCSNLPILSASCG